MQPCAFLTKKKNPAAPSFHQKPVKRDVVRPLLPWRRLILQCMPTPPPHPNKPRDRGLLRKAIQIKRNKSNAPPPACLSARLRTVTRWCFQSGSCPCRTTSLSLTSSGPSMHAKTLQLTAIGAEASTTDAGRSAALTSPQVRSRQLHRVVSDRMIVIVATLSTCEACCDVIAGGERLTMQTNEWPWGYPTMPETIDSHTLPMIHCATVMSLPGERVARAGSLHEQRLRHWLRVPGTGVVSDAASAALNAAARPLLRGREGEILQCRIVSSSGRVWGRILAPRSERRTQAGPTGSGSGCCKLSRSSRTSPLLWWAAAARGLCERASLSLPQDLDARQRLSGEC